MWKHINKDIFKSNQFAECIKKHKYNVHGNKMKQNEMGEELWEAHQDDGKLNQEKKRDIFRVNNSIEKKREKPSDLN